MRVVFGAFTLDLDRRELYRQDRVQPLEPKAFSVLAYLLTHRDRAIAKEELLAACWPGGCHGRGTRPVRAGDSPGSSGRWGPAAGDQNVAGLWLPLVATVSTLPAPAAAPAAMPGAAIHQPAQERSEEARGRRGGGVAGGGPRRPCRHPALSAVPDGQSGYAAVLCRVWPGAVAAVPALWIWQRRD